MAKRVTVDLIDDLTGKPGATTVQFGIDGHTYEIDLTDDRPLRDQLAPWIARARRVGGGPTGAGQHRHDLHLIRQWARENGYPIPARGRIPRATVRAYDQHDPQAS